MKTEFYMPNNPYQRDRFAFHKCTEHKVEGFMIYPHKPENDDMLKENIGKIKKPSQSEINKFISKYPNISAEKAKQKHSDVMTYKGGGYLSHRNAVYSYHAYKFVINNYSKIEVTAMHGRRRKRNAVINETLSLLDRVTDGVPHENCEKHGLGHIEM